MIELAVKDIEKYFGIHHILSGVSFDINMGERIGLIGDNGSGKTTLFRIISKEEELDSGNIFVRKGAEIGYLSQIPIFPENYTVLDILYLAFEDILNLKRKIEKVETKLNTQDGDIDKLIKKYGELQNKFEYIGGYSLEEKVNKVSSGLKMSNGFLKNKFSKLSGGEKTRVILAQILIKNPDIILLDEPTNHLDIDSIEWLEDYIKDYDGTVIIISHDRYFLDRTINKVLELENGKIKEYIGNYSNYIKEKEKNVELQLKTYQNQQKKIKHMEEAINRFKDWGNRADSEAFFKKAKNMEKRIERLDKVDKPTINKKKINLNFDISNRSAKEVISTESLTKYYDDLVVLDNVNFIVRFGEKIALLGKNGSGKSTLFKIINNEIKDYTGKVKIGNRVNIGYLEQEPKFSEEDKSILDYIRYDFNIGEGEARNILALFLFTGDDVFKKIKTLSGGERIRLRLCQLMNEDINLLLLDEPTNHLDISSRERLEKALQEFKGTIFFISHDRYFINKIAKKIYEIENKNITQYVGDYDYFRLKKQERKQIEKRKNDTKSNKNKQREPKGGNGPSKNLLKNIEKLEKDIIKYENLIKEKDVEMNNNGSNYGKLKELLNEKEMLQSSLDEIMIEWLELKEKADNMS